MVAADTRGLLIETLVIRRGTARDEDSRAVSSELVPDASANASGGSSHDGDSTV